MALENIIIMIGMRYEIRIHNIALEGVTIMIIVLLREVQRKSNVALLDFCATYDRYKFCDWIAHLIYYFDLYELSDACRVWFAKYRLKSLALYYWTTVER